MLTAIDPKGNKAEIKYLFSPDRAECYLVTFSFKKGTAQTYWALDEKAAKKMVIQVMGKKVEWEVET